MEDFLKIKWSISGPHDLEHGPEFIPEEKIYGSYVYAYLEKKSIKPETHNVTAKVADVVVPGAKYKLTCREKSRLSKFQQNNCLKGLDILQSQKKARSLYEQNSVLMYNKLKQNILNENVQFLEHAKKQFQVYSTRFVVTNRKYKTYATKVWEEKLLRSTDYAQFYKKIDELSYSYDDNNVPIEMMHLSNILELGSLAKFNPPTLVDSYVLDTDSLQSQNDVPFNSKLPVSKDKNIDTLLETNKVDIVISSGALKRLMDFTDVNCTWNIPVIIKECKTKKDPTVSKSVIFLDKPLPKLKPNIKDFHEYCIKKLLRTNFCSVEAFSFPNNEPTIVVSEEVTKTTKINPKKVEGSLKRSVVSYSDLNDVFGEAPPKKPKLAKKAAETKPNVIYHNVSYRIWNLHQQIEQSGLMHTNLRPKDINVLVRCKLDGCEVAGNGALQPITVVPKLEHQLNYGGGIPTKSELVKEWTSVFIKPFSQLYRVRTQFKTGEVIMVENCNIQKINNEAQVHYDYKPRLGLGVLYKLFIELMNCDRGNYLLQHIPKQGPFVALLKETTETSPTTYDLHHDYENNFEAIPTLQQNWCPIDVNLILPKHRAFNEMPGLFKAFQKITGNGKKNTMQNKSKKLKKKKKKKIIK